LPLPSLVPGPPASPTCIIRQLSAPSHRRRRLAPLSPGLIVRGARPKLHRPWTCNPAPLKRRGHGRRAWGLGERRREEPWVRFTLCHACSRASSNHNYLAATLFRAPWIEDEKKKDCPTYGATTGLRQRWPPQHRGAGRAGSPPQGGFMTARKGEGRLQPPDAVNILRTPYE
jgi:hypothetical protein